MRQKIRSMLISCINRHPTVKNGLLILLRDSYKYGPLFLGSITRIKAYFKNIFTSRVIGYSGFLGFNGGVFNPGALFLENQKILLFAKAQFVPWYNARGNKKEFYLQGSPVIIVLEKKSLDISESSIVERVVGFPTDNDYAIEDFRLFRWKGMTMINHSLIKLDKQIDFTNQAAVCSVLSKFEEGEKTLRFCSIPEVDFPVKEFEKNWVYKESSENLLLFYSLNPYRVLILEDLESFRFKTIINQQLTSKLNNPGGFGTLVSFSTNPIYFDESSWLVVVHQIENRYTGRCYYHWGLLIDKINYKPSKITAKPIFSGMGARGRLPGIRYISSILKVDNEIVFFAGEGDICVTVTKKKISQLESLFIRI